MASSAASARVRRVGYLALGILAGTGLLDRPSLAAVAVNGKGCTALQRRLDVRLRRGLKSCDRSAGPLAALRCAADRRLRYRAALDARGCPEPAWAVDVETVRLSTETVGLRWTSRLNWARLLDRKDDPIASTVRLADDEFENLLLLDRAGDIATVVDYVQDVESRAIGVVDGIPTSLTGGANGRGSFPGIRDHSVIEAAEAFFDVIQSCNDGTPSMFAADGTATETLREAARGIKASADGNRDSSANDNDGQGEPGHALAGIVAQIILAATEPDPPPAEEGQCTENPDGSCQEGGENAEEEQSQEGSDDSEGSDGNATTSTTVPPTTSTTLPPSPPPAPGGSASDPGSEGESCAPSMETIMTLCDSVDWQTPACRGIVQAANGCADESVINPGPEGDIPCSGDGASAEELRTLECERRGGIAQPAPGGELVCVVHDPAQTPTDLVGFDPCNSPESQGTEEQCSGQGGEGTEAGTLPPAPAPDPRVGSLGSFR